MKYAALMWLLWPGMFLAAAGAPEVISIVEHGPAEKRVNVVFLSEGYRREELPRFRRDAEFLAGELLGSHPFQAYANYFNIQAIAVASAESGSDHPSRGIFRDTYFNSSFEYFGNWQQVYVPPHDWDERHEAGLGKVEQLLAEFAPRAHIVVMIVNDPSYGGAGGTIAVVSRHPLFAESMLHEIGHSFASLGEEYAGTGEHQPGSELINATRQTERELISWKHWIEPDTPIPTPPDERYPDRIGLFEGGNYNRKGWYRPALDCKMRTLGTPFCKVCAEALIRSIYTKVRPIESVEPINTAVALRESDSGRFEVKPMTPANHSLKIQWSINGTPIKGATNTAHTIFPGDLAPGKHTVGVRVVDPTEWVRHDVVGFLRDGRTWEVVVEAADDPRLQVARRGEEIEINWRHEPGYELEIRGFSTAPENWKRVSATVTQEKGTNRVVLPLSGFGQLFRLRKE